MKNTRWLPVTRGCLVRLIGSARFWAVLIATALYLDRVVGPIRTLALSESLRFTPQGLLTYLLNDSTATAILMAGCLALLFDLPCTDELQRYLMLRTGRRSWARGQLAYIVSVVTLYLLIALLIASLLLLPCLTGGTGWADTRSLVEDYSYDAFGDTEGMPEYDIWIPRAYAPEAALSITLLLHLLAFSLTAVWVAVLNLRLDRHLGFIAAAIPIGLDILLQEYFGAWLYYLSPLTLCRLSGLDYGDEMGRPPVWYAFPFLLLLLYAAGALFVHAVRKREVRL